MTFLKCFYLFIFELTFLLPLFVAKRCYLSSAWSLKCLNCRRVVMERKDDILNNVHCLERKIGKVNKIDVRVAIKKIMKITVHYKYKKTIF